MVDVLAELVEAERRTVTGPLPFRPDHGHLLDFESDRKSNPVTPIWAASRASQSCRGPLLFWVRSPCMVGIDWKDGHDRNPRYW